MYKSLLYEEKDGIATITLNQPEIKNAFSSITFQEMKQALEMCDQENNIQVVIITGKGKHFSVGGDVEAMSTDGYINYDTAKATSSMSGAAKKCTKPVIAMINGTAAGAGCGLALACDFRIMAESSTLITAFINIGLTSDTGCAYHLSQIVGIAKTMELLMLSSPIKGKEALQLGLATRLVEESQLIEATYALAEILKSKPQIALNKQKKILYDHYYHDYDTYCEMEAQSFDSTGKTADHKEAVHAFLEKRKPIFTGK